MCEDVDEGAGEEKKNTHTKHIIIIKKWRSTVSEDRHFCNKSNK